MINSVKTEIGRESVIELLLSIFKVSDSDPVGLGVFCLYKFENRIQISRSDFQIYLD